MKFKFKVLKVKTDEGGGPKVPQFESFARLSF